MPKTAALTDYLGSRVVLHQSNGRGLRLPVHDAAHSEQALAIANVSAGR